MCNLRSHYPMSIGTLLTILSTIHHSRINYSNNSQLTYQQHTTQTTPNHYSNYSMINCYYLCISVLSPGKAPGAQKEGEKEDEGGGVSKNPGFPGEGGRDPSTPYTGTPRLLGSRRTKDPQERGFPEVPVDVPYRPAFRAKLPYLGIPYF